MAAQGFLVLAAIIYQVSAQCLPPQLITNQAYSCQSIQPPLFATTIIDNSVSNALANALQLLIVSDLIENTLNKEACAVVDSPVCGLPPVVEYPQCTPPVVLQGPCQSQVVEYVSSPVVEYYQPAVEYVSPPLVQYVSPPTVEYLSSPCGGPLAAEVVFPGSIPAQLKCNFGYQPTGAPVVTVLGVETLSPSCGVPGYYY